MMEELKPCFRCGGEVKLWVDKDTLGIWVACLHCPGRMMYGRWPEPLIREDWNRRGWDHDDQAIADAILKGHALTPAQQAFYDAAMEFCNWQVPIKSMKQGRELSEAYRAVLAEKEKADAGGD